MTTPQASSKKYLASFFQTLHDRSPVQIVALGDSLTYGWEASFSYFDLFISKLRADHCGVTITGHNAGVCGDTASGGQRRIASLLEKKPNLLIVQFGINDYYAKIPVSEYAASLGAIARKCLRADCLPLLISSGPLLYEKDRMEISKYYDAMHSVADNYDVPMADISARWLGQKTDLTRQYFPDGVHPNDDGYRMMANALYELCQTL